MPGTGCQEMLANDKREELRLMYQVFSHNQDTLDYITAFMGFYIEQRGSVIVDD